METDIWVKPGRAAQDGGGGEPGGAALNGSCPPIGAACAMRLRTCAKTKRVAIPTARRRGSLAESVSEVAAPRKSRAVWRIQIDADHKSGKFSNHALSRTLYAAKIDLDYGEWTTLWVGDDRPFAVKKAHDLAFVGEHVTSLLRPDRAEVCLPTALATLYALGHLLPETLLRLIDERRVFPRLKRAAAEALCEEFGVQPKRKPRALNVRPLLDRIRRHIQAIKDQAAPADATFALKGVREMLDESVSPQKDPQFPVSTTTDFPHHDQPTANTERIL